MHTLTIGKPSFNLTYSPQIPPRWSPDSTEIRVEKIQKKSLLHQIQERDTTKIKLEKGFIVEIGASEHAFPAAWVRPSERMGASRA